MKKLLYTVLFLAAAIAVSCEEADNGASNDSAPAATIYDTWKPSEAYDSDVDCPLRIVPNIVAEELHVLAEPEADKRAFVSEKGAEAYMQRVVDAGKCFEGGKTVEYIFKELKGDYAITVVAVAGNARAAVEYVFNGIVWADYATGVYVSNLLPQIFGQTDPEIWNTTMQHAQIQGKDCYRLKDLYHNAGTSYSQEGCHLIFEWDGGANIMPHGAKNSDGYVSVPTGFLHPNYGMISMLIDPDPEYSGYDAENDGFVFNAKLTVSAGTLVDWGNDLFIIQQRL